jgi:hypothetical protein
LRPPVTNRTPPDVIGRPYRSRSPHRRRSQRRRSTVDTLAGAILRIFVKLTAIEQAQAALERRVARLEKAGGVATAGSDPIPLRRARPPDRHHNGHQYVEFHAKKHNKSWRQAEALVRRHLLPAWGKLKAAAITRADVRAVMVRIEAPSVANQVLASASAIFSWAVRQEIVDANPCTPVDRNPPKDRERVLSDAEVTLLWPRLDPALKLIKGRARWRP